MKNKTKQTLKERIAKVGNSISSLFKRSRRSFRYNRLKLKKRLNDNELASYEKPRYKRCKNCNEILQGSYCHRCGQHATEINPTIWSFIKQYCETNFQFDSRLFQTAHRLFCNPGYLSLEFTKGHIRRYVSPINLYMFIALLFGYLSTIDITEPYDREESIEITAIATPDTLRKSEILTEISKTDSLATNNKTKQRSDVDIEREIIFKELGNDIISKLPFAMIMAMPLFGLISMLLFRKRHKRYIAHLIYAIHLHCFVFSIFILTYIESYCFERFPTIDSSISSILILWALFYVTISAKRFYDEGWTKTIFKSILLYILYTVCALFSFAVFVTAITLLRAYSYSLSHNINLLEAVEIITNL